jgi:hypothetical protein
MQVIGVFTACLLVSTLSCAPLRRELYVKSKSPDGKVVLSVWWQQIPPDGRIDVTLIERQHEVTIAAPSNDWIPGLAEVRWCPDAGRLAILICNNRSSSLIYEYDAKKKQLISAGSCQTMLRSNLIYRYKLRDEDLAEYQNDPLQWACMSEDATSRFRESISSERELPALQTTLPK